MPAKTSLLKKSSQKKLRSKLKLKETMKTLTQNNSFRLFKGMVMLLLITFATTGNILANEDGDGKSSENEKIESAESAEMIDELLETLEAEELDFSLNANEDAFQVFDKNDEVLFSGSKTEWENKSNKNLIMMKRKAEFLFESNGTKVYKVF